MNEIEPTTTPKDNDENEISLIDLLAVIIRYRRSIIITTLVFLVLSCSYFFVRNRLTKDDMITVTYILKTKQTPQKILTTTGINISEMVFNNLNDKNNFAKIEKKYNVFISNDSTDLRNNEIINTLFKKEIPMSQKNFYINAENPLKFLIVAKIPKTTVDVYKEFITEYVNYCIEITNSELNESIDSALKSIDSIIENQNNSDSKSNADLSSFFQTQAELSIFKNSCTKYIALDENPFEESGKNTKKADLKKIIIITIAGFFVAIFMAFVRNAIENIKKDPKASKKIQDAWNRK